MLNQNIVHWSAFYNDLATQNITYETMDSIHGLFLCTSNLQYDQCGKLGLF